MQNIKLLAMFYFFSSFLPEAPSAPNIISATSPTFDTIELVWTASSMPNGIIWNYQITYFITQSGQESSTSMNTTALEATIGGLESFTNYSIVVAAITISIGDESEVVIVLTNESSKYASHTVIAI